MIDFYPIGNVKDYNKYPNFKDLDLSLLSYNSDYEDIVSSIDISSLYNNGMCAAVQFVKLYELYG